MEANEVLHSFEIFYDISNYQKRTSSKLSKICEILNELQLEGDVLNEKIQKEAPFMNQTTLVKSLKGFSKYVHTISEETEDAADKLKSSCLNAYSSVIPKISNLGQATSKRNKSNEDITYTQKSKQLERAEREIKDAANRKEALIKQFGNQLSNELLEAAQSRYDRAVGHKLQLDKQLQMLNARNGNEDDEGELDISEVEAVSLHTEALDAAVCCMKRTVNMVDNYYTRSFEALKKWNTTVEACDVVEDAQSWATRMYGTSMTGAIKSVSLKNKYEKTLQKHAELLDSTTNKKITRGQTDMANLINEQNMEIEMLRSKLKNYSEATSTPTKKRPHHGKYVHGQDEELQGGGRGKLQVETNERTIRKESSLQLPKESKNNLRKSPSNNAFNMDLLKILEVNSSIPLDQQWLDIQKQYEKFLLSLNEIGELSCNSTWDNPAFLDGFNESPKMGYIFPYTCAYFNNEMFAGNSYAESLLFSDKKRVISLSDWCYISYETLLLSYQHISSFLASINLLEEDGFDSNEMNEYWKQCSREENIIKRKLKVNVATNKSIKQENIDLMKELIKLCRIKLKIPIKTSRLITHLTLPSSDNFGSWSSVHPLDIRYRVLKLLDAWDLDEYGLDEFKHPLMDEPEFKCWIYRQLCFINYCLYLRNYRMQKFVNTLQVNGERTATRSELMVYKKSRRLKQLFTECEDILHQLFELMYNDVWGNSSMEMIAGSRLSTSKHVEDGRSLIVQLSQKMTLIEGIDYSMRRHFYELRRKNTRKKQRTINGELDEFLSFALKGNDMNEYFNDEEVTKKVGIPTEILLSQYWSYDVEALQLILLQLFRCCTDSISDTKMNVNAPSLVQGLLLTSCVVHTGTDPTVDGCREASIGVTGCMHMSVSTVRALLMNALWAEFLNKVGITEGDGSPIKAIGLPSDKSNKKEFENGMFILSKAFVNMLLLIITNFKGFLSSEGIMGSAENEMIADVEVNRSNTSKIRVMKLLNNFEEVAFNSLFKKQSNGVLQKMDDGWTDFDWSIMTYEEAMVHIYKNFPAYERGSSSPATHSFTGISLLLPSRVERVMREALFCRMLTMSFRQQLIKTLCNYRLHLDCETLPVMLKIWEETENTLMMSNLNKTIAEEKKQPSMRTNGLLLPDVLRGPITKIDCYRSFIYFSICKLFDRTCELCMDLINKSPEYINELLKHDATEPPQQLVQDAEAELLHVIDECCTAFSKLVEEVKGEIEYFSILWDAFLPRKQHLAILAYAGRQKMYQAFNELLNSPYWSSDALAFGGSVILSCARRFQVLFDEIARVCKIGGLEADLFALFKPSVLTALDQRFMMVEAILDRCLEAEEWKPLNPPTALHSSVSVDLLSFIYQAYDIVLEIYAPVTWILPSFIKFLFQLCVRYNEGMVLDATGGPINALMEFASNNFKQLGQLEGRPAVPIIKTIPIKKPSAFWGAISRLGHRKTWRQLGLDASLASGAETTAGKSSPKTDESDQYSDDAKSDTSDPHAPKLKRKTKLKNLFKRARTPTANEIDVHQNKVKDDLAFLLQEATQYMQNLTHLSWIVRLHNMYYVFEKLPMLVSKFESKITKSESESFQLCKSLYSILPSAESGGGMSTIEFHGVEVDGKPAAEMLNNVVINCQRSIEEAMENVCRYVASHLVFVELQSFLFQELYANEFQPSLSTLLEQLPSTVEKFVAQAPEKCRGLLQTYFCEMLTNAWCLVICEWGHVGHVYSKMEVGIMKKDLTALKKYFKRVDKMTGASFENESLHTTLLVVDEFLGKLERNGRFISDLCKRNEYESDEEDTYKPERHPLKREDESGKRIDAAIVSKMKKVKFPNFR